jgi:cell wall-associated NlpC family hydrolase
VRRPLLVVLLVATLAAADVAPGLARVTPPASRSETGHRSHVGKLAREVVAYARRQLGVPYSWGGISPSTGFDCSGLVYASYRSIGRTIPRSSWDQLGIGRPVRFGRLRPGDLLFTEGGGHVVLVVSRRLGITAPQTGERVRYVALAELRGQFAGGRRILD